MSGHRYATRGAVNGCRRPTWLVHASILEAIARDALGDPAAADRAVEHALDVAEPDGLLGLFLVHPAPGLLEPLLRARASNA
jgi:LuxR family maltose regulon positive regulatory protein